jgi:hypothetical protein
MISMDAVRPAGGRRAHQTCLFAAGARLSRLPLVIDIEPDDRSISSKR